MRVLKICVPALLALAPITFAAPGGGPDPPSPKPGSSSIETSSTPPASGPRAEAEQSYALAYEEIAKAKKDLEKKKDKNAQKKFKNALERVEKAVALDPNYHEAWNLLGYSARKLGDYDKAFKAYHECLMLKPDYAPAREYMGEARLEKGDLVAAREQLVLLDRFNPGSEEGKALRGAIEAYESAHPEVVKAEAIPALPETLRTTNDKK